MNEITATKTDTKAVTVICPNCSMSHDCITTDDTTKLFGQCTFCDTKYCYDTAKKEAIVVVPASQAHYLYVHLNYE